jgi:hypothetical protein
MPKIKTLSVDIMKKFGVIDPAWGSVCLNYVEIGKTFEDLAIDNDIYISDGAFKPFNFYSADFNVKFYKSKSNIKKLIDYYNRHNEFFIRHDINEFYDARILPLKFPVAEIVTSYSKEQLLEQIQQRQHVNKVYLK